MADGDRRDDDDTQFADALGRAIAARRGELGLKRNDLRDRSGLSYPYIAELENGTKRPSSRALAALAESLELRPSELLERAESLKAGTTRRAESGLGAGAESLPLPAPAPSPARWFHAPESTPVSRATPAPMRARRPAAGGASERASPRAAGRAAGPAEAASPPPSEAEPEPPLTVSRLRQIVREVVREELHKAGLRAGPEPKPKRGRRTS